MNEKPISREWKFIRNAVCYYTLMNNRDITDEFFEKLINFIDLSNLSDRDFFSNERIKKFVDYDRISKKQLIRLITRDPEIINKVNIGKFKFKIRELQYFLKMWPEYVGVFDFNMESITVDELIVLMGINMSYSEMVDFNRMSFSKYHITDFIKNFSHRQLLMNRLIDSQNFKESMDSFHIRTLLKKTGAKYIERLDISSMNEFDWFDVIKSNPEMIDYCDLSIFEKNDCYLLAKLARFTRNVVPFVEKNKEKISNLGWEHLLRVDFETYYPMCCFDCLEPKTQKLFLDRLSPR